MSMTDIAMENCHRHSEFSHQNNCEFPEFCKRLAEGKVVSRTSISMVEMAPVTIVNAVCKPMGGT